MIDDGKTLSGRSRLGKGGKELSVDTLVKVVAAGAQPHDRKPDEQAVAAMSLAEMQGDAKSPVAQAATSAPPEGGLKLTPPQTGFVTDKLLKFTDQKDAPLYEKTYYQSPAGEKPPADKAPVAKVISDKPSPEKAAPDSSKLPEAGKSALADKAVGKAAADEPRQRAQSEGHQPSAKSEPIKAAQDGKAAAADKLPGKAVADEPRARAMSDGAKPSPTSAPIKAPDIKAPDIKAPDIKAPDIKAQDKAPDAKPSKLPTSAEVKGTYVLYDTGEKVLTASKDGTKAVTTSSQTNLYGAAGFTDKDGWHPQVKAGIEHTSQIKAMAKLSGAVTAAAKAEAKGDASITIDLSKNFSAKAKLGVEVGADGKIEGTHQIAKGHEVVGSASANVKASVELSAGLSIKDGLKIKSEIGATAGVGLGGAVKQGGHTTGGYAGVETGVGAAVSGAAGISDGKIRIALDAKLSAGIGGKVKVEIEYDTKWVSTSAAKIVADSKNPNSDLGKALAAAKDSDFQKAAVTAGAIGKELKDQGVKQGKFFGAPLTTAGDLVGTVGKVADRTASAGDKVASVAQTIFNITGNERVDVDKTVTKIKDGNVGEKVLAIAEVGGKVVAGPILDRIDTVKEAIAGVKAADNVGSGILAVGKGLIKIIPGGGPLLGLIGKLL